MWFLKQLHNLVFRKESSVFFQTCHILSLCVGVPTLPEKKKRRIHCWVVYEKALPVTGSWDGCSGVPEKIISFRVLLSCFLLRHNIALDHIIVANICMCIITSPMCVIASEGCHAGLSTLSPITQLVDKPFLHVTPRACLMKKTDQGGLTF